MDGQDRSRKKRKKKKRWKEVAQQVVHTARWVPGAWRGWLRYQTAHTRGEVGKTLAVGIKKGERENSRGE